MEGMRTLATDTRSGRGQWAYLALLGPFPQLYLRALGGL
jgi:hypothetical protein